MTAREIADLDVPDDLMVRVGGGRLWLSSGARIVELNISGDREVAMFANGPLPWTLVCEVYLRPALAQLAAER